MIDFETSKKINKMDTKFTKSEKITTLLIVIIPILLFLFGPWTFTTVKTYEEGVRITRGSIKDQPIKEGLVFKNPFWTKIKKIDMRERVQNINTSTISKEGLSFGVNMTVRYRVKDGKAVDMVKNLETQLGELITSYANATIDDIATGKDKNEMYSTEGRAEIVRAVKKKLNNELSAYADISQVIFEGIQLPQSITTAIESQQAELEIVKQKEYEKQVAEKQADIRRIEAKGIADANEIIQRSLTHEYIQYEAIQKFNPDAEKIYIPNTSLIPTIDY